MSKTSILKWFEERLGFESDESAVAWVKVKSKQNAYVKKRSFRIPYSELLAMGNIDPNLAKMQTTFLEAIHLAARTIGDLGRVLSTLLDR